MAIHPHSTEPHRDADCPEATGRRADRCGVAGAVSSITASVYARTRASLRELAAMKGDDALRPWNLRFAVSGDVTTAKDLHFPFGASLARWGRSFGALGIGYRGAQLVLDLVDRKGKYENGFMHGPVPAWRERGTWRPARIQFTANAIPGMVGSGQSLSCRQATSLPWRASPSSRRYRTPWRDRSPVRWLSVHWSPSSWRPLRLPCWESPPPFGLSWPGSRLRSWWKEINSFVSGLPA